MVTFYETAFKYKTPDPNREDIIAYYETPANTKLKLHKGDNCLILLPAVYKDGITEEFNIADQETLVKQLPGTFNKTQYWDVNDLLCIEDKTNGDYIPYVADATVVDGTNIKKGFTFNEETNKITIINKTGASITVKIYYIPNKGIVHLTQTVRTPEGVAEKQIASATCSQFITMDLSEFPVVVEKDADFIRGYTINIKCKPRVLNGTPLFTFTPYNSSGELLPILRIELEIDKL